MSSTNTGQDPSTLASLHPTMGMDLHYRTYKNAQRVWGSHYLALKQASKVPESSRRYVPGDPVRLIDWKAFARTDQLLIREIRDEASAKVSVVLDLSESSQWPKQEFVQEAIAVPAMKSEVIVRMGFHLSHTFLRQGDFVELWILDSEKQKTPVFKFSPRSPADLIGVFEELLDDPSKIPNAFSKEGDIGAKRDLGFWIGDGLGRGDYKIFSESSKRHYFLQVLSSLEANVDWVDGEITYFDEFSSVREYRGTVLKTKDRYQEQLTKWLEKTKKNVHGCGGAYMQVTDLTAISRYVSFLTAKARMKDQ